MTEIIIFHHFSSFCYPLDIPIQLCRFPADKLDISQRTDDTGLMTYRSLFNIKRDFSPEGKIDENRVEVSFFRYPIRKKVDLQKVQKKRTITGYHMTSAKR